MWLLCWLHAAPVEEYLDYTYENPENQSVPYQIFHLHWQSDMFEDLVDLDTQSVSLAQILSSGSFSWVERGEGQVC